MNSLELLKLAAKAADIGLVPYTWNRGTGWDHEGFTVAGDGPNEWNPLENDGVAFRLAAHLRLSISHHHANENPAVSVMVDIQWHGKFSECHEPHRDDSAAATRCAIVRAAAEIGRALP